MFTEVIAVYLVCINLFAFFLYVLDKHYAIAQKRRIPEASLLGCSMLGGAIGGGLAMLLARHKTRHWCFRWVNLCFAVAEIAGVLFWVL